VLVIGLILLIVGAALIVFGRHEGSRWIVYAGGLCLLLGAIALIVYVVAVLDDSTSTAMIFVPGSLLEKGWARLRRLIRRAFDELAALIFDVCALWRELAKGRPTYKTTPDGRLLRMDYRRPDGSLRTE
jgi:NhaP-type Na+/H+ or K+/H+ antiporter